MTRPQAEDRGDSDDIRGGSSERKERKGKETRADELRRGKNYVPISGFGGRHEDEVGGRRESP